MFKRELLQYVRPRPESRGLEYLEGAEESGYVCSGTVLDAGTGETYPVKDGYLDLLDRRVGADNAANLTNFLPGAGPLYEPTWRVRSLSLLTGEDFSNDRELEVISEVVRLNPGARPGARYLDLGCSAGLYTRELQARLGGAGDVVGIDISPSMLKEAARRAVRLGVRPSLVRANAKNLPFADGTFVGTVCGGSLNEFGDPARILRETRRVVEPGGRLAIMGILKATTPWGRRLQRFLATGGLRFFEPAEVKSLLDHAGLEPDPLRTNGAAFFAGATRR